MFQRDFYLRQHLIEYFGRQFGVRVKEIDEFWDSLSEKDKDDYAQELLADVVFGSDGKMFIAGPSEAIVAWFSLFRYVDRNDYKVSLGRTSKIVSLHEYFNLVRAHEFVTMP